MQFAISAAAMLAFCAASGAAPQNHAPAAGPWPTYNNGYDGQRFSALKQINTKNISNLKWVCEINLGELGVSESGPLVIGRTIYVTTLKATLAADAANCRILWRHVYEPQDRFSLSSIRGAAYSGGILVRGTADARLIGLDAVTGRELWRVKGADPARGAHFTSAPIAWDGLVYMGTAGSEWGLQSRMMAFDIKTGHEVWHFNLIPEEGEPGAETWKIPHGSLRAGAGTWSSYTLDTETGEIYIPAGNPAPAYATSMHEGDNLYSNSIVALDAKTGKLRWYFQTTPADPWDYDQAAAPVLYRLGSGRRLLAAGSKDGYLYAVDRTTHRLVFRTAITTINDPAPAPTVAGVVKCPGFLGGVEWNGPAFDPLTQAIYIGSVDWCMVYKAGSAEPNAEGIFNIGGTVEPSGGGSQSGWVHALDAAMGAVRWKYHAEAPVVSGITPTAGGLVFGGDLAGNFFALDAQSGSELFKFNTGGSMAGGIVTYSVDRRQYVAAMSGSVTRAGWVNRFGAPKLIIMTLGLKTDDPVMVKAAGDSQDIDSVMGDPDSAAAQRGGKLYLQLCTTCHGGSGEGISAPRLAGLSHRADNGKISAAIKLPKGGMPAFYPATINDLDVSDLVEFIGTLP